MAIHIVRDDGTHVDVTHNQAVLDLVATINDANTTPPDHIDIVDVPEATESVHINTTEEWLNAKSETVTFTLKGVGWQWIRTEYNEDGSTTITLGR